MAPCEVLHHSAQRGRRTVDIAVQVDPLVAPPPAATFAGTAPVIDCLALAHVVEYLAPVPAVHAAPAQVAEDVAPARVTEYETPARAMDITDSLSPHISLLVVQASAPQVMETLRTLDVAMPPSVNEIVDVIHLVPREPGLQHTDEHIVGVPVVETQKSLKLNAQLHRHASRSALKNLTSSMSPLHRLWKRSCQP